MPREREREGERERERGMERGRDRERGTAGDRQQFSARELR